MRKQPSIIITCEHAGHEVPPESHDLFADKTQILKSHRGWDAGALQLARILAGAFNAPLFQTSISRLVIDCNRSRDHRSLFSSFTRELNHEEKNRLIQLYYTSHRERIESWIQNEIENNKSVLHIAVHTFTPILRGVERNAEVGLLYDPQRSLEKKLCRLWGKQIRFLSSHRIRMNYPYRGTADGLATMLRKRHDECCYAGIELEVNQSLWRRGSIVWERIGQIIVKALDEGLEMMPETAWRRSKASS